MGKFCTNCGRALEEGNSCICLKNQSTQENASVSDSAAVNSTASTQQKDSLEFFKTMWVLCKKFNKNPADSILTIIKDENYKAGLFFVLMQALITSIFVIVIIKRAAESILGYSGYYLSEFLNSSDMYQELPYLSIILKVSIGVLVQFFILTGLIYLTTRLSAKKEGNFNSLIATVGVSTLPVSLSLLVSALVLFIIPSIVVYIIIFGYICGIVLNYIAVRESFKMSENKAVYIIPLSYCLYLFIIYSILIEYIKSSTGRLF